MILDIIKFPYDVTFFVTGFACFIESNKDCFRLLQYEYSIAYALIYAQLRLDKEVFQ